MSEITSYLLTPNAIRERCSLIYDRAKKGDTHFKINEDKLSGISEFVLEVIKENYPDLNIPFHSRWGHFKVGGINRAAILSEKLQDKDPLEKARCMLDLVITSVLLDAGAGPKWKYIEDGKEFNRSEGLGVASFHMFMNNAFNDDNSFCAKGDALQNISAKDVERHFQADKENPLVGAQGRATLLSSLGKTVLRYPEVFKDARPGNIIDYMIAKHSRSFEAQDLLQAVLDNFGDIWPSRINFEGVSLGDVWSYPPFGDRANPDSFIPFHKLSQWLTYSLIEPIMDAGIEVKNVSKLTGLAEYRNGGLLLDYGLIELRDPSLREKSHKPDSEIIIEWRALTVTFLDKIADIVREKLGFTPENFPLAKVLEGGTWWAGRKLAAQKRSDSSPPLNLDSDGTVF